MSLNDLTIANGALQEPIQKISKKLSIDDEYLIPYGNNKAKIDLRINEQLKDKKDGKLILVTAINPTKAGEGKTTTTIGLNDALNKLGVNSIVALREPSMGPVFGLKGGACGGGYAQVNPMVDINLHFTGDMHAITSCNNLICACLDNHLYQGNELNIDPDQILIKRCLDMNDRTLREITIGEGKKVNGITRQDGFVISVASEVMACLCLAKDLEDLGDRLDRILIAYNKDNQPVYVKDLAIKGSLIAIMKDAINPNLVQSLENNPVLIHGGPFANIAHGCNSLIATKLGLKLADYVVTEAGFGADLGAEKFLDIKSRIGELHPNSVVIVATIRALKAHGYEENDLVSGCEANLLKHIETIRSFGIEPVVAINQFSDDTEEDLKTLNDWLTKQGVKYALSTVYAEGSEGGLALAKLVLDSCKQINNYHPIYELDDLIETKIKKVAQICYGASGVEYSEKAKMKLMELKNLNKENLPICMAKTPMTLADKVGVDISKPFNIHVDNLKLSNGAGFIVVECGGILLMPGLPKKPNAQNIKFVDGILEGLS